MSTRSGAYRQSHPIGLQVLLAAVVALLVVVGIALAVGLSGPIDATGSAPLEGAPGVHAPNQTFAVPDYGIVPHGPDQMPKRFSATDYDIRPHGPNQMPKRDPMRARPAPRITPA